MSIELRISARKITTESSRRKALAVLEATYRDEKAWVRDVESQFPAADLNRDEISWFLVCRRGRPVGVLRVVYDPPIEQYLAYGLTPIDLSIDIAGMIRNERIAEIGRFAVVSQDRNALGVAAALMRAATREIVARGYTQLVTDVFETDPHSPFGFHTRVVGFRPIATHETGELAHRGRRITLVLDIKAAYQRLKSKGKRFFRSLTRGWPATVHRRLAT